MKRLKYGGKNRAKALLGLGESGAILAAAAIQSAATTAGAVMGARAQADAAKQQAAAMTSSAARTAQSIAAQNENNNNLQQQSIEFTKEQNKEARDQQNDIQMTLQMIAGRENRNQELEARKLAYKSGGRKRVRNKYLLRGSAPFNVTDGGGAIPLGQTDLGNLVYELYGNDHEHYHKAQGGKNKTGVGVKFADGNVVEGEGNQGSSRGELLMIDPAGTDARFISKHSIPNTGFNPRLAVEEGMSPEEAFQIQEYLKAAQGLDSDGKKMHPRRRNNAKAFLGYANSVLGNGLLQPNMGTLAMDNMAAGIAGGVALQQDDINKIMKHGGRYRLKKGGRCKAIYGDYTPLWAANMPGVQYGYYDNLPPIGTKAPATTSDNIQAGTGGTSAAIATPQAPRLGTYLGAAGISALGGVLGNLITNWGNNRASGLLADAYANASRIMADAYSRMGGIDMSAIRREDYNPSHALAAVRSARYNINPQLEDVARQEREAIRTTNRSTASSATRLNRLARIQAASNQERSKLYALQGNEEEKINQANNQAINYMANANADRDTEARKQFMGDYLGLLQYNNDIENSKIAGIAQAESSGILEPAKIRSQNRASNYGMWGNTLAGIGNGFGNAMFTYATDRNNFNNTMLGATTTNQILSFLNGANANEITDLWQDYRNADFANAGIIRAQIKRRANQLGISLT